jgi:GT2 family glycosyltransferase
LSRSDTYPQHVVTAVIVAHDGTTWLPSAVDSLLSQTRPVQRVVAVDTGSRDRSGAVLAGLLGRAVVFGMDRNTGYGTAVEHALQHRAANISVPVAPGLPQGERVEWVWLLHDDCEPAPDALEQLLRGAAETRSAAVLGPKIRDWADRRVVLEAGVSIDSAGRRITGIEPREVDHGQHDGDRDVLAVSSAGMLVRRDVWEQLGGFSAEMALFRDDTDFCWRVHAAGYRVRVITDAVVYHVEASARRRRSISVTRRPHRLDRRNALLTLLGNLPAGPMLAAAAGNVAVSLLRGTFFLLAKRLAAALDEFAALASVLAHPVRLARERRLRSRGRRAAYGRLRSRLPKGQSAQRLAEYAAALMSGSAQLDTAGSHHATDDPAEDDFLLTDTGIAQRVLTNPGVLLFAGLTVLALVAERSLLGAGPLGGGALVPAWGGASGLWRDYLQGFHPAGVGSGSAAPPWLAVVAALATVLGGKPWLAIDVILLGCVPLAGMTAFLALRRVTRSVPVRVWAAGSYALLPVAVGTVAAGRFGTAAVFVLIPVIALLIGRMLTEPPRRARRAAWATGLAVALAAAFVPLVWVAIVIAAVALAAARPALWRNLAIVALVPPVLLIPWTFQMVVQPSALLLQAGVQQPGLASHDLPARSVLLLSPGGPGLPPFWVTAGLAFAALAALLLGRHRALVVAGWAVALFGLAAAVAVSRVAVTPAGGGPAVPAWPGVPLIIAAAGLLLAGAAAGDRLSVYLAGRRRSRRRSDGVRLVAAVVLAAACSTPVLVAVSWVMTGVRGPVTPAPGPVAPAVVSASSGNGLQLRTLVLRSRDGRVSYALLRGASPSLADPDLLPAAGAQRALATAVAALVAPNGGEALPQGQALSRFDIGFVLMPAPVNPGLAGILDGVAGLRPVSSTPAFALWRLIDLPSRVRLVEPDGHVVAVPSGQVGVSGAAMPAAGGVLELAEPVGGWTATLDGKPLTPTASPAGAWAQAFKLPPGGGSLDISRDQTGHDLVLLAEGLAVLAVAALALPGTRAAAVAEPVRSDAAGDDAAGDDGADDDVAGDDSGEADIPAAAAAELISAAGADGPAGGAERRFGGAGRRGHAGRGRGGRGGLGRAVPGRRAAPGRRGAAPAGVGADAAEVPDQPAGPAPRGPVPDPAAARGLPPGSWRQARRPGADPAAPPADAEAPSGARPYVQRAGGGSGPLRSAEPAGWRSARHASGPVPSAGPVGVPPGRHGSGPLPSAEPASWPTGWQDNGAERRPWPPAPRSWDSGPYQAAGEPASWDSGPYQAAGEPASWDSGPYQGAGEPASWDTGTYADAEEATGWQPGGGDALVPLPPAQDPAWPGAAGDDSAAMQWPIPEPDGGGEGW